MAAPTASTMEETSAARSSVNPREARGAPGTGHRAPEKFQTRLPFRCCLVPGAWCLILFLARAVVNPPVHVFLNSKSTLLDWAGPPADRNRHTYLIRATGYGIRVNGTREVRRFPQNRIVGDSGISVQSFIRLKRGTRAVAGRNSGGCVPFSSVDRKRFVLLRNEPEDVGHAGRTPRDNEYLRIADTSQRLNGFLSEIERRDLVACVVGGAETSRCKRHRGNDGDGKQHDRDECLDEGEPRTSCAVCSI